MSTIKVIYQRSDRTYMRIPIEINLALQMLEDEFQHGDSFGSLVATGYVVSMTAQNLHGNWNEFKPRAVGFLRDIMKLVNRENGYGYDRP